MSSPPTAPPTDAERELDALLDHGRRLAEELETLQKQDAYLQSEIARHDDALVTANEALAALPKDASPTVVFEAKQAVVGVEFNRNRLREQLADLQPELLATPSLISANEKATAKARAES